MSDSNPNAGSEGQQSSKDRTWLSEIADVLDARTEVCKAIATHAQDIGLDCDWTFVNRHLDWFRRWHMGLISTGHLMGRTGVKRKKPNIEHWSK